MVKLTVNLSEALKKASPANIAKAELAIANQALLDMDRFVPLRHGPLRGSGHISGNKSIVWNTPYARAQFYGGAYNKRSSFTFSNYTTPGTGKRWDLKAKPLYGEHWAEVGRKALGIK